jgi:hypothetical protein
MEIVTATAPKVMTPNHECKQFFYFEYSTSTFVGLTLALAARRLCDSTQFDKNQTLQISHRLHSAKGWSATRWVRHLD